MHIYINCIVFEVVLHIVNTNIHTLYIQERKCHRINIQFVEVLCIQVCSFITSQSLSMQVESIEQSTIVQGQDKLVPHILMNNGVLPISLSPSVIYFLNIATTIHWVSIDIPIHHKHLRWIAKFLTFIIKLDVISTNKLCRDAITTS